MKGIETMQNTVLLMIILGIIGTVVVVGIITLLIPKDSQSGPCQFTNIVWNQVREVFSGGSFKASTPSSGC